MVKRLICVCMLLGLLLSFCACGTQEETSLVGLWTCRLNLRETVSEMVGGMIEFDDELPPVTIVVDIEFREDGTFSVIYDQDHISQQIDDFIDAAWNAAVNQLAKKASLPVETIEKAIEGKGLTKEILKQNLDLGSMFAEYENVDGYWLLEESHLYLGASPDALSQSTPIEISLRSDKFSVVGMDAVLIPGLRRALVFYRVDEQA